MSQPQLVVSGSPPAGGVVAKRVAPPPPARPRVAPPTYDGPASTAPVNSPTVGFTSPAHPRQSMSTRALPVPPKGEGRPLPSPPGRPSLPDRPHPNAGGTRSDSPSKAKSIFGEDDMAFGSSSEEDDSSAEKDDPPAGAPAKLPPGGIRKLPLRPKSMSSSASYNNLISSGPKKMPPPIFKRPAPPRPTRPPPTGISPPSSPKAVPASNSSPALGSDASSSPPLTSSAEFAARIGRAHTSAPRPAPRPGFNSVGSQPRFTALGVESSGHMRSASSDLDLASPKAMPGLSSSSEGTTYLKFDLNALDIESLYPTGNKSRSSSNASIKSASSERSSENSSPTPEKRLKSSGSVSAMKHVSSFFGSIKTKISSSTTSTSEEKEVTDEEMAKWPSVARTRRQWGPRDETDIPKEVLALLNTSCLDAGFHIELGDKACTERYPALVVDHQEEYVHYYRDNLYCTEHMNYIGLDEESDLYVIVSVEVSKGKRDKVRALVRTRKDYTRVLLDASAPMKSLPTVMPEMGKVTFMKIKNQELADELMKMEEKEVVLGSRYKFGVLYALAGQTEDQIFANEKTTDEFEEFLDFIGDRITLLGWTKYKGGLDVKSGSTGEFSVYRSIHNIEVMFHVCTLLPAQEADVQRVERKRHIGNDVVTFVYLEEGAEPFVPPILTSQFIHIVVAVRKVKGSSPTKYAVSISTKFGVEPHLPPLPHEAVFEKSEQLRDYLITKCINAERTTMLSPEFRGKMMRSRKEFLKLLYGTFSEKKKNK